MQNECTADQCAAVSQACAAEPDCADLDACFDACDGNGYCGEQCKQSFGAGYEPLMALYTCLYCGSCLGECWSSDGCPIAY